MSENMKAGKSSASGTGIILLKILGGCAVGAVLGLVLLAFVVRALLGGGSSPDAPDWRAEWQRSIREEMDRICRELPRVTDTESLVAAAGQTKSGDAGFYAGYMEFPALALPNGDQRLIIRIEHEDGRSVTPEQLAAFTHFVDVYPKLKPKVMESLFNYEQDMRRQIAAARPTNWGGRLFHWLFMPAMPEIDSAESLESRYGSPLLVLYQGAKDGFAHVGLEFDADFDPEHCYGVIMHRDQIIEAGLNPYYHE